MWSIIGIDCATQPNKIGLALAHLDTGNLIVDEVEIGSKRREPVEIISEWIKKSDKVLLALDAPLGWPDQLGSSLVNHQAGEVVAANANELFRRCTDDEICQRLGKRPLEVGANLIARTAEAALRLLDELRDATGCEIQLAWDASVMNSVCAIEVYPAATLSVMSGKNDFEIIDSILSDVHLLESYPVNARVHVRDAVICALSGADFLNGTCIGPTPDQRKLALKEGWIWTRSKQLMSNTKWIIPAVIL